MLHTHCDTLSQLYIQFCWYEFVQLRIATICRSVICIYINNDLGANQMMLYLTPQRANVLMKLLIMYYTSIKNYEDKELAHAMLAELFPTLLHKQ